MKNRRLFQRPSYLRALSAMAVVLALAFACKGKPTTPATIYVEEVNLKDGDTPLTAFTLKAGESRRLSAEVLPAEADDKSVVWSSDKTDVATVTDKGLVTALKVGTATITVMTQEGFKTASVTLTVTAATVAVTDVRIKDGDNAITTLSLSAGQTRQLVSEIAPTNATNTTIMWGSDKTDVATVTAGLVRALKAGTATITATTQDGAKVASITLTVTAVMERVTVTGVSIRDGANAITTLSLGEGQTRQLTSEVSPTNAVNKAVTWSSSNGAIATVTAGLVNARAAGTATITATTQDGAKVASVTLTVTARTVPVTSVSIKDGANPITTLSLGEGQTRQLTPEVLPTSATNKTVTWSSSNLAVATVTAAGLVNARAAGTATITTTTQDGAKVASVTLTVTARTVPVTSVSIKDGANAITTLSLGEGQTRQLTSEVLPTNATNKTVAWNSSNGAIATVSGTGLVSALRAGTATITATTQDGAKVASVTLTVSATTQPNQPNQPVISREIRIKDGDAYITSLSMNPLERKRTITAEVLPANTANKAVRFTSSDDQIVYVAPDGSEFFATTRAAGTATITVTTDDGGAIVNLPVTVTIPPGRPTEVKIYDPSLPAETRYITTLTLKVGETKQLRAEVLPADATNNKITWNAIGRGLGEVTVSQDGLVTAVSESPFDTSIQAEVFGTGVYDTVRVTVVP